MTQRILILSDLHCDEPDAYSIETLVQHAVFEMPDVIVLLGDVVGAGAWSRHPRQTSENARETMERADMLFRPLVEMRVGLYWCMGNHEHRINRAHNDAGAMDLPWGLGGEMLCPEKIRHKLHIRRYTDGPMVLMDNAQRLLFFHGDDGKGPIPTLRRFGYKGHVFQGHNHQLYANCDGGMWAVRCGHLGPVRPDYVKGPAPSAWQRGYVVYEKGNVFLRKLS